MQNHRKIRAHRQRGATLLELILVMGLVSLGTVLAFEARQADFEQQQARVVGTQLSTYNNAVRNYIAKNPDVGSSVKSGSAWLKNTTCGGPFAKGQEFLSCDFPSATVANPINFGTLALTTQIDTTGSFPNKRVTATTTTGSFSLAHAGALEIRSDLAGIAALTAASSTLTGVQSSSAGLTPYGAATDARFRSNPQDAKITMTASNIAEQDVWLRTDGANRMHAPLRFDGASASSRTIEGASRIQNLAGEILYLGTPTGKTPLTAARVVADANTEILGELRVRESLNADGSINARGDLTTQNNLTVAGTATVQNNIEGRSNINAAGSIAAGGSISAKGAIRGTIFYDENDERFQMDPTGTSVLNNVQSNNINNLGALNSQGRITAGEYISINGIANEGWGCDSNGTLGRDASGKTLSCQNGRWASNSVQPSCQAITIPGYANPDVTTYACPVGYTKTGWDTTGSGWRGGNSGAIIGQNDYAVVFCCKF